MDKPVFAPSFWQGLADSCPTGEAVSPAEVESWFNLTWPVMLTYIDESKAKAPRVKRTVCNWWKMVRPEEIEQARDRLRAIRDAAEAERLNALHASLGIHQEPRESSGAGSAAPLRLVTRGGGRPG